MDRRFFAATSLLMCCIGCGHKATSGVQATGGNNEPAPAPLLAGMTSYLNDLPSGMTGPGRFNSVVNPGAGISMVVPAGFEWSGAENVLAAFSNVIGMNESSAPERSSPIHVFYALPDALRELKFATTLDVNVYTPMDYEHYLGKMKASKSSWKALKPMMTSMGMVPIHELTQDGTETYSNGDPKHFKIFVRQYALCWKSSCVIVTTVIPEPMDIRFRRDLEQAIGSICIMPKANGDLILPPEGPKASHYSIKGATRPGQMNPSPYSDPLDEVKQINEFNRQNQQRNTPITDQSNGKNTPPQTGDSTGQKGGNPPTTPPPVQDDGGANEQKTTGG